MALQQAYGNHRSSMQEKLERRTAQVKEQLGKVGQLVTRPRPKPASQPT